jgi:hypothetical protein
VLKEKLKISFRKRFLLNPFSKEKGFTEKECSFDKPFLSKKRFVLRRRK